MIFPVSIRKQGQEISAPHATQRNVGFQVYNFSFFRDEALFLSDEAFRHTDEALFLTDEVLFLADEALFHFETVKTLLFVTPPHA
ncbi:hypothetical protein Barb4_00262 [Bacteroidales bacterium Barb4]|nr:hypothetical protein Barb4_00262 [Bacteroidales bacterium Barb4]